MIERNDDLPPSYEVAIGIKQEDQQFKIQPPPNYELITTNNSRLPVVESDVVHTQPLGYIRSDDQPEFSCTTCMMITLVIAACLTVFILGLRKDK